MPKVEQELHKAGDSPVEEWIDRDVSRPAGCVRRARRLWQELTAAVILGLGAVSLSAHADSVKVVFPDNTDPTELPEVWPEQAGVDSAELVKLSQWIRDSKLDIRSLVVLIVRWSKGA